MSKVRPIIASVAALASVALVISLGERPLFIAQVGSQPVAVNLEVNARDLTIGCPGAALRIGGSNGLKVGAVDRISNANVTVGSHLESDEQLKGKLIGSSEVTELMSSGIRKISNAKGLSLTAGGSEKQSSYLLSALQTQLFDSTEVRGLAATSCQMPAAEHWLVGAETVTGRESVLLLQNSSDLDATANLQVFTDGGVLESASLSGIVVGANDFTAVPLASLAPKAKTIALHITSSGGALTAWVQQKTTRGLATGGIDLLPAQPEASLKLALPGLFIRGSKRAQQLIASNPDYSDLVPSLHVFVPGDTPATFTAQIVSSTDGAFGTVIEQTVAAASVSRFEIPALSDGDYAVLIDSDQPIQATVTFSRVSTSKPDFAYLVPAQQTAAIKALAAPAGFITRLSLVNPNASSTSVTVSGAGQNSITLDKNSSAQLLVKPGELVVVESDLPVSASLVIDANGAVSVANLLDYRNEATKVSVLVR